MNMNKNDLVKKTAEKANITNREAKKIVEATINSIGESLARGESVSIKGFGTFKIKERSLKRIRHLHTKEMITVPSARVPAFKPGKKMKDNINETGKENVAVLNNQKENQDKIPGYKPKQSDNKKKRPKVIAVTSGKGGTGKTNFVINTAIALSQRGQKVYLLDADLGTANVDVLLGLQSKYTINTLVEDREMNLRDIIVEGPEGVQVIPGGSGLQSLTELPEDELGRIVSMLKPLEEDADIIMIDTGSGISRNVVEFAMAADEIVVVITPEPHSISDAYAIIKVLTKHEFQPPIKLVFNLVENLTEAKKVSTRLTDVTDRFLDLTPQTIGHIVKDDNVVKSVKQFRPFVLYNPLTPASRCVVSIAEKLLPLTAEREESTAEEEKKGFLGKLRHLFSRTNS